jgi:hypothetical protein
LEPCYLSSSPSPSFCARFPSAGQLSRNGYLGPGAAFTLCWSRNEIQTGAIQGRTTLNFIVLSYRHQQHGSDKWQQKEYPAELVRTPCHFGGERTWCLCPARGCGRRVAVLYGSGIFACRHCHQLAYESHRNALANVPAASTGGRRSPVSFMSAVDIATYSSRLVERAARCCTHLEARPISVPETPSGRNGSICGRPTPFLDGSIVKRLYRAASRNSPSE